MKQFRVEVKEINFGAVVIKAENEMKALEEAHFAYGNGQVFWGHSNFETVRVYEEKEGDGNAA